MLARRCGATDLSFTADDREDEVAQPLRKTDWQFRMRLTICLPSDPALQLRGIQPTEINTCVHIKTLHLDSHRPIIHYSQTGNSLNVRQQNGWANCYIHAAGIKEQPDSEDELMRPHGRNQTQARSYSLIPFIGSSRTAEQIYGDRNQISSCPGRGGWGTVIAKGTLWSFLGRWEWVLYLDCTFVCLKSLTYTLQMGAFEYS